MAAAESLSAARRDRAYQRPDGLGFRYRGETFDGFTDRPQLPLSVRVQVARWAVALDQASPSQRELMSLPEDRLWPRGHDEAVREQLAHIFHREDDLLENEGFVGALMHLEPSVRNRILDPQAVLGRYPLVWPLTVRQAAEVLGVVTENQLRDWDEIGACRAERWGEGSYRGYFRSNLVKAAMVREMLASGISLEAAAAFMRGELPQVVKDAQAIETAVAEAADLVTA